MSRSVLRRAARSARASDSDEETVTRLIGHETPTSGQELVDGPSLELVVAMRQAQPIGQVRAGREFFGAQDSTARVDDLEPRSDFQLEGHGLVHRPVLCKCAEV
jgi:hypothetical protein